MMATKKPKQAKAKKQPEADTTTPVRPAYTIDGVTVPGGVMGLTRLTLIDVDGVEARYRETLDDIAETILGSLDEDADINSMATGRIAATVLYAARQWNVEQWTQAMRAAVNFAKHGSAAEGEVV